MGYRSDRLVAAMAEKGWTPADLARESGVRGSQISRYRRALDDPKGGKPDTETIAKIVLALELDTNYLLDTDERYAKISARRAVAKMSLDRYLAGRELDEDQVPEDEERDLRLLAEDDDEPPLWIEDWRKEHARVKRLTDAAERRKAEEVRPGPRRSRRVTS